MTSATDNRTTELLPCPFCGGEARHYAPGPIDHHIECVECYADIHRDTEAEAIAAWNTRAELGSGTCENINTDGYRYRFECSECGYSAIVHNCAARLDELPNYCPNCGAKVIKEVDNAD